LKVERVAV